MRQPGFPEWLKGHRTKHGYTLRRLASFLRNPTTGKPMSPQYLNHLERGKATPSDDVLVQLAKIFNVRRVEAYAAAHGKVPHMEEYLRTYPDQAAYIDGVFCLAVMGDFKGVGSWEAVNAIVGEGAAEGTVRRRFGAARRRADLERFLRERGISIVFGPEAALATDRATDNQEGVLSTGEEEPIF